MPLINYDSAYLWDDPNVYYNGATSDFITPTCVETFSCYVNLDYTPPDGGGGGGGGGGTPGELSLRCFVVTSGTVRVSQTIAAGVSVAINTRIERYAELSTRWERG